VEGIEEASELDFIPTLEMVARRFWPGSPSMTVKLFHWKCLDPLRLKFSSLKF
jgi:hypothetical protein